MRRYFAIPSATELSDSSLARAALQVLPVGSTVAQIGEHLHRVGADADSLTRISDDGSARIVVRVNSDTGYSSPIVKSSYVVIFDLGPQGRVSGVSARVFLTGP